MAQPLVIALPPNRVFSDQDVIRVTCLDATDGSDVTGVTVQNVIFELELLSGSANDLAFGPFMLVPGPGA